MNQAKQWQVVTVVAGGINMSTVYSKNQLDWNNNY
jgi:hypothetical protein